MGYQYLVVAIASEVTATYFLKASDTFTKPIPSAVAVIGYVVSFYFLSLTLRTVPTGVAYAVWSGAGIIAISAIAWIVRGEKLDAAAMGGMALIIVGIAVMNLFSRTASH